MKYISTRGHAPSLDFKDVIIQGLASDGGLYVPQTIPSFTHKEIAKMAELSYQELCVKLMQPFVGDALTEDTLHKLVDESYAPFSHKEITPLTKIDESTWLLELFHGPTLAFKDVALQFLGRLFNHILEKQGQRVAVLGATSGDTGSAAIYGCMASKYIKLFILHPYQRISDVQRKQMTTVLQDNVYNLAIKSDFDFCQSTIKTLFNDPETSAMTTPLAAINSINWCRILAQIVYYFYAALRLGGPEKAVSFSVPTGNLGDIFAGYIAHRMGLPINKLIIATNENDIMHRFIQDNDYRRTQTRHTLSPSMDIQVASNFERLLFHSHGNDADATRALMEGFKSTGHISVSNTIHQQICQHFASYRCDDHHTVELMRHLYEQSNHIIDPHTATGIAAAHHFQSKDIGPVVVLATAHPAKFPEAAKKAGIPLAPLPNHLADLFERQERYEVLSEDIEVIKEYVMGRC